MYSNGEIGAKNIDFFDIFQYGILQSQYCKVSQTIEIYCDYVRGWPLVRPRKDLEIYLSPGFSAIEVVVVLRLALAGSLFVLWFAGVGLAAEYSDENLTDKIVGEWFAQDHNGSTVYTFNEDGTWSESGVYYFKEGPRQVFLSGEWYVSNGFLYHSVVECSVPAKIKPGKYDKIRIKHVTDNEFFLRLKPGKSHPHLKIQ